MKYPEQLRWLRMKETTKKILSSTPKKQKTLYAVDFKSGEYEAVDCSHLENVIPFKKGVKSKRNNE